MNPNQWFEDINIKEVNYNSIMSESECASCSMKLKNKLFAECCHCYQKYHSFCAFFDGV
jgi:hypothetical protein